MLFRKRKAHKTDEPPGKQRFLVGLGNPGKDYGPTRHNAGFRVIDRLWAQYGGRPTHKRYRMAYQTAEKAGCQVYMAKPLAYMNRSGPPVRDLLAGLRSGKDDLLVIHDDIDMKIGKLRLRAGGSSGGHRGIASIIEALGDADFHRLKIGVGRPSDDEDIIADFVLSTPQADELEKLSRAETRASEAAWQWISEPLDRCMNEFNKDIFAQEGEL